MKAIKNGCDSSSPVVSACFSPKHHDSKRKTGAFRSLLSEILWKDDRLSPSILTSLQICFPFHVNEVEDGGRPSLTRANKKLSLVVSTCWKLKSQPEMVACYRNNHTELCKTSELSGTEKHLHGKHDTKDLETHFYRTEIASQHESLNAWSPSIT